MSADEWDEDADNAALIAAQNRESDPEGDPEAPDPGAYEEAGTELPNVVAPDSVDDFSDLEDGDDSDEDLDGDEDE